MTKLEIIEKYKRYLKNSALADKDRNLVQDYTAMMKWFTRNHGTDSSADRMLEMLYTDAMYMTITKAVSRNIKFKELAQWGEWDGSSVKKGAELIQSILNSKKVGDVDATRIQKERLFRLLSNLNNEGRVATVLYIVQRWLEMDSAMMGAYRSNHRDVEILLQCSAEGDIDEMLESMLQSSEKKPSSPAITETTIVSSPEAFREIRERAYDAYQEGDTLTVQQCIKDVTALYAKGYFNRQGFTEESAASLYNGCVSAFKKYIMRIEGEDERSATNPLDIMKTIIVSSTEPMDGETS